MQKLQSAYRYLPGAGVVTFLLGAALGWLVPSGQTAQRVQLRSRATEMDGEQRVIAVEPVIDQVSRKAAGSAPSVVLHWDVENLLPEDARFTYAWVLSNDRSKELFQGKGSNQAVGKNGLASTEGWELPPLEEGYYRLELTSVMRGKSGTVGNSVTSVFLEVKGGDVTSITGDQWELESQANMAVEVGS